ncbi:hypothetical protein ACIHEI_29710 [Kitasatospora sp. NPDC051984]|uniref:hypothetical protein n=1 Tax=Kitasatospora sp. NPDC051984 TaxID=3364059 RepID=UPI0037CA76A2
MRPKVSRAGSAAGLDLCLHLIASDYGAAARSGLGSGESLRQHLNRQLGMTPAAYRSAFAHRPAASAS